jgi:xanthine dehydrogenase accessory factor
MKEINDIIKAYDIATSEHKKTAMATVVHVEGSSYRRPGARMLITEDGMLTGAISGGCLEGDALRKALLAINDQKNKLVTYDTTDEDDAKFGVQLGCNGIVHILFEPILEAIENNPLQLLKRVASKRRPAVLTTLFSLKDREDVQPGTQILFTQEEVTSMTDVAAKKPDEISYEMKDSLHDESFEYIQKDVIEALNAQVSVFKNYEVLVRTDQTDLKNITAFIEVLKPPIALHIFGAGNDAIPLVRMATLLGWELTIIDGRRTHATAERFPDVREIIVSKSESSLEMLKIDERTVTVLMTHNYNYDIEVMRQLSETRCSYIGVLGPKKKLNRMFDELAEKGTILSTSQLKNIYSPVGLDIGAETAEEIALSIAAEIQSVFSGKNAQKLRDKVNAIHH